MMQGKQSTLTGVAALLFAGGLILMFAALYRDAAHGGPLLWVGLSAAGRDDRLLVCRCARRHGVEKPDS